MMRTLLAGAFCVAAASAASIVEIAAAKGAPFTSLVGALKAANLVETLSGKGPFTVFAPTDDAFKKLAAVPEGDALKNVLLSHVVAGTVLASDLKEGQMIKTLSGAEFTVKIMDKNMGGSVMIGDATVVTADVKADNGVVHIIDTVLVPKAAPAKPTVQPAKPAAGKPAAKPATVVDIAAGNKDFSTLVSLVTKAGLGATLADKSKRFTVFAPVNAAFAPNGMLKAAPEGDALKSLLLYHVVDNFKALKGNGQKFTTLNGAKVDIEKGEDGKFTVNGAKVLGTAKAKNGYVYIIDTVLQPPIH